MLKCRNGRGSAEDRDAWRPKIEEIQLGCSAKEEEEEKEGECEGEEGEEEEEDMKKQSICFKVCFKMRKTASTCMQFSKQL